MDAHSPYHSNNPQHAHPWRGIIPGGQVLIGGDFQGKNPSIRNLTQTSQFTHIERFIAFELDIPLAAERPV